MMKWLINHPRIDMDTDHRNGENPKAIAKNGQWNDCQAQDRPFPRSPQKQITSKETRDKQYEAGMNPAAFLRHLDGDSGKLKEEPSSQNRLTNQAQQRVTGLG